MKRFLHAIFFLTSSFDDYSYERKMKSSAPQIIPDKKTSVEFDINMVIQVNKIIPNYLTFWNERKNEEAHMPHAPPLLDSAIWNGKVCIKLNLKFLIQKGQNFQKNNGKGISWYKLITYCVLIPLTFH